MEQSDREEKGEIAKKRQRQEVQEEEKPRHDVEVEKEKEEQVIIFPNSPANIKDFHWSKHGVDNVREGRKGGKKQPGELTYVKEYFICSEKKKGGTCKAKKTVHHLPGGDSTECIGTHNHPPPEKPKTDPEVQKKIEEYSQVGAKASVIQSRLMKEANEAGQPITRKNVPTKQKIYNTQHKMAMAQLPTGTFIIICNFFPCTFLCCSIIINQVEQAML
jgi:hypothetical protein